MNRSFDRSIVEGPITRALWKLAWPTMLQNVIGGLQGMVDHVMVGHFVGYTGNAAIGVSWQILLVVIVFMSSISTGMGVMVARFAGAHQPEKVNRTVQQASLVAVALSLGFVAPVGWLLSPWLLSLVNAAPEVKAQALPYLRVMFALSFGMMTFFMIGGALRAAGDARTPLKLSVVMTLLNLLLNAILIPGLGPAPRLGTTGAALGTVVAAAVVSLAAIRQLFAGKLVIALEKGSSWKPDWNVIRALFRLGLPTGYQGVAMNVAGVLLLRFIGSLEPSAAAQAAYAVGYTELFSLITWTSVGLMGATAAVAGQNLGAGKPERVTQAVRTASRIGLGVAGSVGALFLAIPQRLLGLFGMDQPEVVNLGIELLAFLSVSGMFVTVALTYTGGLQGTGDTKGPLYISLVSQIAVPLGLLAALDGIRALNPADVWLAILLGHITRCLLSVVRFRQEKWRQIQIDIEPART